MKVLRVPPGRPIAPFPGDLSNPQGFRALAERWIDQQLASGKSTGTMQSYRFELAWFSLWARERGITRPIEVTRPILERYQRHLFHYRKKNGAPLSFGSQIHRIAALKAFYRWLVRQNEVPANPASDLEVPRKARKLPREVLTADQVEIVLSQPDIGDPEGLRDRAILETFYSTGMRRLELSRLAPQDLDRERGVAVIREGKGRKDRFVPIGERAIHWIDRYLDEVRPHLVVPPDPGNLFLSITGQEVHPDTLTHLAAGYVTRAKTGKKGACHLFRHSMATIMLENGADIRYIQQILGHSSLETTQIYTRVSIGALREIHRRTHPAASLERRNGEQLKKDAAAGDAGELRMKLDQALAAEREDEDTAK
jgi:integrase/recombinase XerD